MTRPKDRFVETLSEVPATCLKENENGNLCTRSGPISGHGKPMTDTVLYSFGVLLNTAVLTALVVALGRLLCNIWADARP